MSEMTFSEYGAQVQLCYNKAQAAKGYALKHLWLQMAQDWMALAETVISSSDAPKKPKQAEYLNFNYVIAKTHVLKRQKKRSAIAIL